MGTVRKINRFVDMLQDHVLHVVPVVSMGNYFQWVIIFWRYLFRIAYLDLFCGTSQFSYTSKVIVN